LHRATRQVEQYLERFALRCAEAGVACKPLQDSGSPADSLFVEAQRYDLVVLGQRTYFQFATRDGADATLSAVLRNTPRPVVVVPPKPYDGTPVLVAYDGSLPAARALYAFQASGLHGAEDVHVLSVGDDHVEAARHADRAVEFLGFHNVKAAARSASPGPGVADTILDQARRLGAGLIVMGCYGQPVLREFFLGSVTRAALERSTVPLFLYH
jgi:nucleotide-binding universal stress UspA family protein